MLCSLGKAPNSHLPLATEHVREVAGRLSFTQVYFKGPWQLDTTLVLRAAVVHL